MPARSRAVATTVAVGVVLAAMCLSFVYVPPWLVRHDAPSHQPAGVGGAADAAKNQATDAGKAIGDARSALVSLMVAIGAGLTLYFTWQTNRRGTQDSAFNQRQAREARLSDNFVKAVNQLGAKDNRTLHIGGIYGLDRVLRTVDYGEGDYWAVMDVLSPSYGTTSGGRTGNARSSPTPRRHPTTSRQS